MNPGPIQFNYEKAENKKIAQTYDLLYGRRNDLAEEIRGICHSIQNDVLFSEHQHLLHAALSSLKSAKAVINSLAHTMGEDEYDE